MGPTRPLPAHRRVPRCGGEVNGVDLARALARGQRVIMVRHDPDTDEGRVAGLPQGETGVVDDWKAWIDSQRLRLGR